MATAAALGKPRVATAASAIVHGVSPWPERAGLVQGVWTKLLAATVSDGDAAVADVVDAAQARAVLPELPDARGEAVYSAKIAEQSERYQDMAEEMKKVAVLAVDQELSLEERNLLSVAYKNLLNPRRASWRALQSIEQREQAKGNEKRVGTIKKYRDAVEGEIGTICLEVLTLLDKYLIPSASTTEAAVWCLKLKADSHRYLAEYKVGEAKAAAVAQSLAAYKIAQYQAIALPATNPTRLGVALNYAVFCYQVMDQPLLACCVAKKAFDEGLSGLDSLGWDSYKDSTLILQLLRDNLTLWTSEMQDEEEEEAEELSVGV